jgi:hypothetical protein
MEGRRMRMGKDAPRKKKTNLHRQIHIERMGCYGKYKGEKMLRTLVIKISKTPHILSPQYRSPNVLNTQPEVNNAIPLHTAQKRGHSTVPYDQRTILPSATCKVVWGPWQLQYEPRSWFSFPRNRWTGWDMAVPVYNWCRSTLSPEIWQLLFSFVSGVKCDPQLSLASPYNRSITCAITLSSKTSSASLVCRLLYSLNILFRSRKQYRHDMVYIQLLSMD